MALYSSHSQENLPDYKGKQAGKASVGHRADFLSRGAESVPVKVPGEGSNKRQIESQQKRMDRARPLSSSSSTLKPHLLTPSLIGRPPISNIGAKTKLRTFISPAAINQKQNREVVLKMILKKPFACGDGQIEISNQQMSALAYASTGKSAPK